MFIKHQVWQNSKLPSIKVIIWSIIQQWNLNYIYRKKSRRLQKSIRNHYLVFRFRKYDCRPTLPWTEEGYEQSPECNPPSQHFQRLAIWLLWSECPDTYISGKPQNGSNPQLHFLRRWTLNYKGAKRKSSIAYSYGCSIQIIYIYIKNIQTNKTWEKR